MSSRCIVSIVIVLMLAWTPSSAWAFFDTPWITSVAPHAGEVVSVTIREGICDAIVEHRDFHRSRSKEMQFESSSMAIIGATLICASTTWER